MAEGKHKVTVTVPERPEYKGVWAGGRYFMPGTYEVEVSDAQLQNMAFRRSLMTVVKDGKVITAKSPGAAGSREETLSQDEWAMLDEYRKKRAEDPAVAQKYGAKPADFTVSSETPAEAKARLAAAAAATPADVPVKPDDAADDNPKGRRR